MMRSILAAPLFLLLASCSPSTAEDKAAALVVKMGGMVTRDEKQPGEPVVGVHLRDTPFSDTDLSALAPMTNLVSLNLSKTQVTDAGMKQLSQFKNLKSLGLRETQITDAGLKELTKVTSLTSLYLGGAQVSDAGINDFLKLLPSCEVAR
ncbi:MAG: hypothetical protein C0467_17895 [Planctomycetaceae bacterium]|nr:hypothetical protein [Planctomycetaceae bacterium]